MDIFATIDRGKGEYENRIRNGETRGRRKSFDREELKKLIAAGTSGKECARILGVNESIIYHDPVWVEREKNMFYR